MKIEFNTIIFKSTPEFFIKGIQDKPPYSIREFEGKEIEEIIKFHAEFEEGQKKRIRIIGTHDPSHFFEREITDITWLSYFHGGKYGGVYIYGFAWEKKGEEFNLEIGYTRQGEALSPLALSGLADNGSFGLEKWLLGIKDEKAKKLLRDGIAFCDYIIDKEFDGIAFSKSKEGSAANVAKNAAWSTKKRIMELIEKDAPEAPLAEAEARAMQAFFNSESVPILRSVLAQQLSRERRKL